MDMSNKTLALLLVAAIVVSLGGTLISLDKINQGVTGFAAGQVNLTITDSAACSVPYNVSFGAQAAPSTPIVLGTDQDNAAPFTAANCATAAGICSGLLVNNTGNVLLAVNFTGVTGVTLLGSQYGLGTTDFMYWARNGTTLNGGDPGCLEGLGGYTAVTVATQPICRRLNTSLGKDTVTAEFNITVQPDISSGTKTAAITITCSQTT